MTTTRKLPIGLALLLASILAPSVPFVPSLRAEETVTLPKSRLEELERKEKELDALKGELTKARGETERLQRAKEKAEQEKANAESARAKAETERAKIESEKAQLAKAKEAAETKAAVATAAAAAAAPLIAHDTPALASLPPLKKGDVVDAMDLMNHYRADAAAAAGRYGKQRLRVRGVVTGFEKPMFQTPYVVFLQSTERKWRILCTVRPPDEFKATFPAKHGETLVAVTRSDARLTLMHVGQTVEIEGTCKGLDEQTVKLAGCRLVATE